MDGFSALAQQAASFGLCLGAGWFALHPTRGRAALKHRVLAAMPLGSAVWAAPFASGAWPADTAFDPLVLAAALIIATGAVAWALVAHDRADGHLRIIGPGAILGTGVGLSCGVVLFSLGGAGDSPFDDARFSAGVAIASAFCVLAFVFQCRGRRHARLLGAGAVAIGATACATLASGTLDATVLAARTGLDVGTGVMGVASSWLVVVLIAASALTQRSAWISRATKALAWRENRRLFRALRRVGIASPRPANGRSAAGQAADLGHPVLPAR